MSSKIDLQTSQIDLTKAILRQCLPVGSLVYVFGSRAKGKARQTSDLDLAIDAHRKLTLSEEIALKEAFDESDMPMKVDVVDLNAVSDTFRQMILPDLVPLALV